MLSIARGLANILTDGRQIVGYPGGSPPRDRPALRLFSATVALILIVHPGGRAFLRYRPRGAILYAIGGSAEVARLAGIEVERLTVAVYVTAGALAGVAGMVLAARLDSAQPSAGTGYELDTIAAVVIGGASLTAAPAASAAPWSAC